MKSQAEAKRAGPSFPCCASTILQLGLTATNGQEQGQETEVEPGPLTPFHSILFGNLPPGSSGLAGWSCFRGLLVH